MNGKDFYLGVHGTQASKTEYDRLIAEWLVAGRQIPSGSDLLLGRGDQDILIGGATSHDANANALFDALAEWTRSDLSQAGRIAHLRTGGGLNGSTVLTSLTVSDDDALDIVTGGSGVIGIGRISLRISCSVKRKLKR